MSSVTFTTAVGGDGSTVSDDASPTTGLANGGHRTRFVPALSQMVAVANGVVNNATTVAGQVTAATTQAGISTAQATISTNQATISTNQATISTTQAGIATAAAATSSTNAGVYATTAAGLAGTSSGGQFQVISSDGLTYNRYRNDSGTATLVGTFPSANIYSTATCNQDGAVSYSNPGGSGDRTASIVVAISSGLLAGGTGANLVNGSLTNNYTNAVAFVGSAAATGAYIQFDFGVAARRVVTEATWKQSGTQTHGTWQWQGSNDGSAWTNIGSTFTLGGSTAQAQTSLANNLQAYRYYQLLGISGTVSGGPYVQEVEFKIARSAVDGFAQLSTVLSNVVSVNAKSCTPGSLVAYYPCDEGSGTNLRDIIGGATASINNGGGTVGWTQSGWLQLTAGWFKLPVTLTQTVCVLFRCAEGYSGYNFCVAGTDAIGQQRYGLGTSVARSLHGWGVSPMPSPSPSGAGPIDLLAGGWCLVSLQNAAAATAASAIGCANLTGSSIASAMEVAGIAVFSGAVSDADLRRLLNFVAAYSKPRGIYLTPWVCPKQAHLTVLIGESTAEGTYPLSSLSTAQISAANEAVLINARNTDSAGTTGMQMMRLSLSGSYANNNPLTRNTQSGMEVGFLNARIARTNDGRPLHILKAAKGATYLSPVGTYTGASGSTINVTAALTRSATAPESAGMAYILEIVNMRRMENIARNFGIGYTTVNIVYAEGINDAYIGTSAVVSSSNYQGYVQAHYSKLATMSGISNLKMIAIKPHLPSGGLGGGDPDYPNTSVGSDRLTALGYIRSAFDAFQAANSSNVSLLDGNSYALNTPSDYVHPSASGYDSMGQDAEALFSYKVAVIPAA